MRASHDLRIDGRHDKGTCPGSKVIVPGDTRLIGLVRPLFHAGWVQRVGVHNCVSNGGVFGCLLGYEHQARHRTAADATGGATHAAGHPGCVMPVSFVKVLLQKIDRQVGWHRVKATAMHQARAARLGDRINSLINLCHPLRLASEITVVRALVGARLQNRCAVLGVRSHCADQCAGSPCHGAELISIAAIGDDNGQVRHAELASHLIESLLTPTGNRPIQLSVLGCKVLCDQLACETRCAVKHDLKLPLRHHEISRCSQASTVASLLHVTGSLAWYLFAGK